MSMNTLVRPDADRRVVFVGFDPLSGLPGEEEEVEELTPREHDVLQLLAEGLTNRTIAQRLSISEHTVKFHVMTILGKLGAHTRTEAVMRAVRRGLIAL